MKDTVAIVGSHPGTRGLFDFERDDCDVWVFNEAMKEKWCIHADAVFQMHLPVVWRTTQNRNDPKHYEWLKSGDTPPLYMLDQYEDVPKAVKYPLSDVLEAFPTALSYFTSSVSYAIALGIYKGYRRIEVYGVEMETNTEYGHQRVGVAYWVGVAHGKGTELVFHSPSFFKAPLYGYDADVRIPLEVFKDRIEKLKEAQGKAQEAHSVAIGALTELIGAWVQDWKTDLSRLDQVIVACGQTGHNFGMVDGALQTNEQYLARCNKMLEEVGEYLIVRQHLESQMHGGDKERNTRYNEVHAASGILSEKRKALNSPGNVDIRKKRADEFGIALQEFVKKSTLTGIGAGIMTENRNLMMIYDKQAKDLAEMPVQVEVEA